MEAKPIALSVLMTREEYMQLTVQIHRLRAGGPSFFTLAGGILAILSIAGLFFGHYIALSRFSAGCLLLFGVFLMCYEGIVAPILDKARPPGNMRKRKSCAPPMSTNSAPALSKSGTAAWKGGCRCPWRPAG